MDIQIIGTVLISISLICGTWYAVTVRKIKATAERKARRERNEHNERIANNESLALYQEEKTRRETAETMTGIVKDQLRRSRNEVERLKALIKELEENN